MSWDIFISKIPVDQLSDGNLKVIGPKTQVIQQLKILFPPIEFINDSRAYYRNHGASIAFSLDEGDEITHFMLYIRGSGDYPITVIRILCEHFNCYAMDGTNGQQMEFDQKDVTSFGAWKKYLKKITKPPK